MILTQRFVIFTRNDFNFFSLPLPLSLCFRLLFVFVTRDCYGTIFQPVCVCITYCVFNCSANPLALTYKQKKSQSTLRKMEANSLFSRFEYDLRTVHDAGTKTHLTLFFFSFCLARTLAHNSDSVHSTVQVVKGYRVRDKRIERGRENEREKSNMRQGMPLRV